MLKKFIIIILMAFIVVTFIPNMIYAMDNIIGSGDNFIKAANGTVIDENAMHGTSNYIFNILFAIAVVLAVAIGMVIGIQFMMGSADEKAKIKETLVPYVVGVFIVFSAFTIWKIAINIGNDITQFPESSATGGGGSTSGGGAGREDTLEHSLKQCPYCGTLLLLYQEQELETNGSTVCINEDCGRTITK